MSCGGLKPPHRPPEINILKAEQDSITPDAP